MSEDLVDTIAYVICAGLLLWTLAVSLWVSVFGRQFFRKPSKRIADSDLPRAAIVMGFKGADPFLVDSLEKLMQQDYPDYEMRLVIDSREDPAWAAAEEAIARTGAKHVVLEAFRDIPEHGIVNCTNSKVVQAIRGLDESFTIVAMADGDISAHKDWLREIVQPLVTDDTVGVATGHRWFMPTEARFGSIVRYVWNAAAVPIMYCLNMAWGGCYAIRTSTIRQAGLLDKWAKIAALDMHTTRELKAIGLSIRFVPSLMVTNREDCSLGFALNFIRRQLIWAKLYNPGWPLAVFHTLGSSLLLIMAIILIPVSVMLKFWFAATIASFGLLTYVVSMSTLVLFLEYCVRRVQPPDEQGTQWLTSWSRLQVMLAIPITQFVQLVAVVLVLFARRVVWRGAVLEITGPSAIRVVDNIESRPEGVGTESL